eukprot:3047968-Pleurochrysis_carterae.AAC.2
MHHTKADVEWREHGVEAIHPVLMRSITLTPKRAPSFVLARGCAAALSSRSTALTLSAAAVVSCAAALSSRSTALTL